MHPSVSAQAQPISYLLQYSTQDTMNRRSSGASTSSLGSSLGSRNSRPCEYASKAVQTTESLCRRIESVELGCGRGRTSHLTILRGPSSAPAQGHKIGGGCSPRISFLRTLIRCEWRLDCRSQWWELLSNLSTICATLLAFWLCNSFIIVPLARPPLRCLAVDWTL